MPYTTIIHSYDGFVHGFTREDKWIGPVSERGHSCDAPRFRRGAALSGFSQLALHSSKEHDGDHLGAMLQRMCGSIDETKAQHALVRWGDLHQRMTSGGVPLVPLYESQYQVEIPDSEGSFKSLGLEATCAANILPSDSDNEPPAILSQVHLRHTDREISRIIMRSLQGSLTACALLLSGQLHTVRIRPLAMHKLLKPLAIAGLLTARLMTFVHHFTSHLHCHDVDATQLAFAAGVRSVLHMHTVQLQTCMKSVRLRREAETNGDDMAVACDDHPTPNELMQHTSAIRAQVQTRLCMRLAFWSTNRCAHCHLYATTRKQHHHYMLPVQIVMLASLCWCYTDEGRDVAQSETAPMKWETGPFPHSSALLDHIHTCAMPHLFDLRPPDGMGA